MNFFKLKFYTLILFLLLMPLKAVSLTCKDVKYVDTLYKYGSALSSYLGCEEYTTQKIVRYRKSEVPLIKESAERLFYASPQPLRSTKEVRATLVREAVNKKEFFSLLYADAWEEFLDDDLLKDVDLDFFAFQDPIVKKLAHTILAAASLLDNEYLYLNWHIPEFDTISLLMESKSIPFVADYLSYAYLNGIGLAKNFDEARKLSEYASETMPEAQRYLGINLIEVDVDSGLELLKRSVKNNYIEGIEDYVNELTARQNYLPNASEELIRLMPILEALGYAGHPVTQRILATLYNEGNIVEYNKDRALAWYKKAAAQFDTYSADFLVQHYSTEGNFKKVAEMLSISADRGFMWDRGYFSLFHAIKLSENEWSDTKKLLEYIKYHCLNNAYVSDEGTEVCKNYPIKEVEFDKYVSLKKVIKNLALVDYANRLDLSTGKYLALVIGNQDYENWTNLETPLKDIATVSRVLEKNYDFEVTRLENATRREILQAIYSFGEKAEFNDHVLIYYAGHGIVDEISNEGYWIPSNADETFRPDWVSNSEVKRALATISSRHLLVTADSCYSGTIIRSGGAIHENISNSLMERLFNKKAKVAITSGGNEPVADSTSGSNISIFAKAFTDALSVNNSEFIAASALFSSIRDKVSKEANQTPQYANIRELDDDGGEFVFRKVR